MVVHLPQDSQRMGLMLTGLVIATILPNGIGWKRLVQCSCLRQVREISMGIIIAAEAAIGHQLNMVVAPQVV